MCGRQKSDSKKHDKVVMLSRANPERKPGATERIHINQEWYLRTFFIVNAPFLWQSLKTIHCPRAFSLSSTITSPVNQTLSFSFFLYVFFNLSLLFSALARTLASLSRAFAVYISLDLSLLFCSALSLSVAAVSRSLALTLLSLTFTPVLLSALIPFSL